MLGRLGLFIAIGIGSAVVIALGPEIVATESKVPSSETMKAVGKTGPLDGMEFVGELGPEGKPKDVADVFVFDDGTFVSKECELRCDFPARAYFVSETERGTEFVSKTRCPYKNAEIVWHGTVEDDRISGRAIWTMKRWYWTVTNTFEFEGTLSENPDHVASET